MPGKRKKQLFRDANATKKDVKKMIISDRQKTAELKYYETLVNIPAGSGTGVPSSGLILSISDIGTGTGDLNRIGDSLTPVNIEYRQLVDGTDNPGAIRTIVFRWIDDSTPTPINILQVLGGVTSNWGVMSPYDHDQRDKFQVLYDVTKTPSNVGQKFISTTKYLKLGKKPIRYSNGTTVGRNKIFILFISNTTDAVAPTITFYARMNYYDY